MFIHFPHFQILLRVEVFGPVLHFWWNPLEYTLYLTGTLLERRAAEHFYFEFFTSTRDKPWFSTDFNERGNGREGEFSGDNEECGVADDEEWRWQCKILVERARALVFPLRFTNRLYGLPQYGFANDKLD